MALPKRKFEEVLGSRRVRPRIEREEDLLVGYESEGEDFAKFDEEGDGIDGHSNAEASEDDALEDAGTNSDAIGDSGLDDNDDDQDVSDEDEDEGDDDEAPEEQPVNAAAISFGQLARAHASLQKANRQPKAAATTATHKTASSSHSAPPVWQKRKPPPARSSKHAPAEVSSKRAVKRGPSSINPTISSTTALGSGPFVARDPRFDPAVLARSNPRAAVGTSSSGPSSLLSSSKKSDYAFLEAHRAQEIRALRTQSRDPKATQHDRDRAKRQLARWDSQQRARDTKILEAHVRDEHRQKERELAAQGKKPFFLKRAELKKRVMTERYSGLSDKQAERAVERRRKKVAGKEKKELGATLDSRR